MHQPTNTKYVEKSIIKIRKMKKKTKRLLILILAAVVVIIIAISFLMSINPVFYIPIVLVAFLNRNRIRDFFESVTDNNISEKLKKNDFESVIEEENTQKVPDDIGQSIQSIEQDSPISSEDIIETVQEEKNENTQDESRTNNNNADIVLETENDDLKKDDLNEEKNIKTDQNDSHTIVNKSITHKSTYSLPKNYDELLDQPAGNAVNKTSAAVKGEKVMEILQQNGISAELINTYIGPRYTRFEIKPDSSVKLSKIKNLSEDIRLQLAASETFIEAPIPGRSSVGIDVPNVEPVQVRLFNFVKGITFGSRNNKLLFPLGCELVGKPVFCDLEKAIHLLIGGTTGSGKTMCLHSIILSLLLRTKPDEVKLVLIDPSKIEFSSYVNVPHLLWPVIDEVTMAYNALRKLVVLAEERYEAFSAVGVRNFKAYNEMVEQYNKSKQEDERPMEKLPYIVVIVDQFAEISSFIDEGLDITIQRLTQLARICGMHIIISTQRPSTDVITGVIKSSFPSRISFSLPSAIDSKTVLDASGAEQLLGNGDMLYHPQGQISPLRVQGVYVSDKEIQKITQFVKSQAKPQYEDSYYELLTNMSGSTIMSTNSLNADVMDSLYDDVVEFVKAQQKASTSLLQRRFGIGYNRASRLIDTLEDRGVIGPANGAKPREVYLDEDVDDANDVDTTNDTDYNWLNNLFRKR